ncbi:MAG: phytanoyl-CoA dioxygenase family protein [Alphaproteobacteria bacterium]|jgi:phytanoyl-CoA hydroxylase|nr:phytanoyl-CoA dioxygenase family protein [Alphaproteobacteria bacterium]
MSLTARSTVKPFSLPAPASSENATYYRENGYVIVENLIDPVLIDAVLRALEDIKKSPTFIHYAQSIHRWIRPRLSAAGFLTESIENPTRHANAPRLQEAVMNVLYSAPVSAALTDITGAPTFVTWQDMLFDRSTGTIDHQDAWYLDTNPAGHLLGAWFALEDITLESGPFHVYPQSHLFGKLSKEQFPNHDDFRNAITDFIERHQLQKKPALLKKGTVLFWNSLTVHGASSPLNEQHSRKSLTTHFYPLGYQRQGKTPLLVDLKTFVPTKNPRIFRVKPNAVRYTALGYIRYLLEKSTPKMDMNRARVEKS